MKHRYLHFIIFLLCILNFGCTNAEHEQKISTPDSTNTDNHNSKKNHEIFLWVEGNANYANLASHEGIQKYVKKAKEIGVTHLIIDVKGTTGKVLYNSKLAPKLLSWDGTSRSENYNYLSFFIKKAHAKDLKVYAAVDIFKGGAKREQKGIIYNDPAKNNWTSHYYQKNGTIKNSKFISSSGPVLLDPARSDVQNYELSIVNELVTLYPKLDGLVLNDSIDWAGIKDGFSKRDRKHFEEFIGKNVGKYPENIYKWKLTNNGNYKQINGKYYKKWLEWRASVIYIFMKKLKESVKSINPDINFSIYVGSWYGSYYRQGINWASNSYNPYNNPAYRNWATQNYHNYGLAQMIDIIMAGDYASKIKGSPSVQSQAKTANRVTKGDTKIAESLYLNTYMKNNEIDDDKLKRAIKMCYNYSSSVMLFDAIYFERYHSWNIAKRAIKESTGKNP